MKLFLIAVWGLTGCDRLLDFQKIDPPDPVVPDGPDPDASPVDAARCDNDGTHDEDHDNLPDRCDLCPTVTSDNSDMDGDGVGNECDPRPDAHDRIDSFYPFTTKAGVMATSGTVMTQNDGLVLDPGAIVTSKVFGKPLRITVGITGYQAAPPGGSVVLTIDPDGNPASCEINNNACPNGAHVCIFTDQNFMTSNTATTLSQSDVETLTLYRTDDVVRCGINDITQFHSPPLPGPMPSGTIQVSVPSGGPITLPNMIVYNTGL